MSITAKTNTLLKKLIIINKGKNLLRTSEVKLKYPTPNILQYKHNKKPA